MKMNKYITIKGTTKQVRGDRKVSLSSRKSSVIASRRRSNPLLALLLAFSLVSCVNNIQPDEISEDSTTTAESEIAYITLGEPNFGNNSRTIIPNSSLDYSSSNLTNLVFTAQKTDGAGNNVGSAITLASADAFNGLSGKKIPIEPGTYNLKLIATLSGAPMEDTIENQVISNGTNSRITFNLKAPSNFLWGGCNLHLKFDNTGNKVSKVVVTLKWGNSSGTVIDTKEFTSSDFVTVNSSTKQIDYMRQVADESQRLDYGFYYITFDFYKTYDAPDNRSDLLNSICEYMYIDQGHWTTWTSNIYNINDVYTIDYKYYVDDAEDSTYTPASALVLPGAYSSRSEELIIPAITKEDYTFLGWYTDSTFTTRLPENASNQQVIAAGSTGAKDLYARFIKPELYVSSSATDDSGSGFTETAAFKTFGAAISKIDSFTTPLNWTIYIDGEISGNQTVSFTNNTPTKLTISGKTGNSTDKLTGSSGTTLTVNVSQTFETDISNLTITGGTDSGLKCTKGIVSLLDGVNITGNTASGSGSGVYVSAYGSLKMGGSAVVTTDNDVYLTSAGQSIEIATALSTTNTDPVAKITPYEITDSNPIVSGETLSTSYNRFLISPVTNAGVTTMYKVGSDGKITDYLAAGDIIFTDQTVMTYTSGLSFSDDAKARAVGVIYLYISPTDPVVIPRGILGKVNTYHDDTTKLGWVNRSEGNPVTNYDTELVCSVTGEDYSEGGKTLSSAAVAEGDSHDGSTHASLFRSKDSSSTYATLDYADSYGTTNFAGTSFASDWYIPSVAEMITIGKQKDTLNTILTAIGGTTLGNEYWTSSLYNSSDNYGIWSVGMVHNNVYLQPFHYGNNACCVHQF